LNAPVSDTAILTVDNASPTLGAVTVPGGTVAVGASVPLSTAFADAGTNDGHTASVQWGDATTSAGSVTETAGSGSVGAAHSYGAAGTYTVTVTVTDDNGGIGTGTATVVVNGAPLADAGGPYAGVEGSPVTLAATASDPNGDALAIAWTFTWTGGPGTACTATATTTLAPSVTCNDDATVTATLQASDSVNPAVVRTATVDIANVAPTIGALSVPVAPVPLGSATNVVTTFADAGRNDTHTATVNWGDATTSSGSVTEVLGSGSVAGAHVYAGSGTYNISVTVTDDNGGSATTTATTSVVVYDRSKSFVTGGGWIDSPSAAHTPSDPSDPDVAGRGNFGFVSRYQSPSSPLPTGQTEFQLRVRTHGSRCDRWDDDRSTNSSLNFHSTGYAWLVVDGDRTKAYYRGTGTVNGVSGYEFIVSVIDGRRSPGPDRFRIKVWKTSTGVVLYDNQAGAADDASATQAISGGSIVIH
jgi:PKD repeat protein